MSLDILTEQLKENKKHLIRFVKTRKEDTDEYCSLISYGDHLINFYNNYERHVLLPNAGYFRLESPAVRSFNYRLKNYKERSLHSRMTNGNEAYLEIIKDIQALKELEFCEWEKHIEEEGYSIDGKKIPKPKLKPKSKWQQAKDFWSSALVQKKTIHSIEKE